MKTSYFAKMKGVYGKELVSIANKTPDGFRGRIYKKLAPKYDWWIEWKNGDYDNDWYIKKYKETVLSKLDPDEVMWDLGDDAILCCYETPEKFCHRHIVAEWLREAGYEVEEYND